jgi:monomeric isocitrate dehydrogenase
MKTKSAKKTKLSPAAKSLMEKRKAIKAAKSAVDGQIAEFYGHADAQPAKIAEICKPAAANPMDPVRETAVQDLASDPARACSPTHNGET